MRQSTETIIHYEQVAIAAIPACADMARDFLAYEGKGL